MIGFFVRKRPINYKFFEIPPFSSGTTLEAETLSIFKHFCEHYAKQAFHDISGPKVYI